MPRKPKPLSTAERPKSTSATRMKRQASKMRELGYVPRQVWGRKDAWPEIMASVEEINGRHHGEILGPRHIVPVHDEAAEISREQWDKLTG